MFEREECKVNNCKLSFDKGELERADLVLFEGTTFKAPTLEKPDGQVNIYLELILHLTPFSLYILDPLLGISVESYVISPLVFRFGCGTTWKAPPIHSSGMCPSWTGQPLTEETQPLPLHMQRWA